MRGISMRNNSSLSGSSLTAFLRMNKSAGFTLIEIIVGIVMLSISLSIVSTLIVPTEEQSADQILQVKAAELGQSLLNDITSRAFDNNSDMAGGRFRCDEDGQDACTDVIGRETGEITRDQFNDVDDFNGYQERTNAIGGGLDGYDSFTLEVDVVYAGGELDIADDQAKRITVTVTTSLGTAIKFSTHKANF